MGNNRVYGRRDEFAVSVTNPKGSGPMRTGEFALWFQGRFLGDIDQSIFVEGVLRSLRGIVAARPHASVSFQMPKDSAEFLSMIDNDGIPDAHYFLAREGFDDFLKLFFKNDKTTKFVWSLHPNLVHDPLYEGYGDQVYVAEVSNTEIARVVSEVLAGEA